MPPRRRRSAPEGAELSAEPSPPAEASEQSSDPSLSQQETATAAATTSRRRSRRKTTGTQEPSPKPAPSETVSVSAPPEEGLPAEPSAPQADTAASPARQQRGGVRRRKRSPEAVTETPSPTQPAEGEAPAAIVPQEPTPAETAALLTAPSQVEQEATEPAATAVIEEMVESAEEATATAAQAELVAASTAVLAEPQGAEGTAVVLEESDTLAAPPHTTEQEPVVEEEVPARRTAEPRRRKREGVRLGIRQGHPEIIINGEPVAPLFFFGNVDSAASERRVCEQIQQAASAGIHLHSLLLELPVSVPMVSYSVHEALRLIHLVREHDPEGYVMFRVVFTPPPDWQKLYPEAMTTYADGSTGEPSFASDRYWQEAESALTLLVRQLEATEEARFLLGYHLDCREWFYEYQRGYDYCPAAQEAFRQWLRGRYRNDVVALRAAWHDGSVTFTSASVPAYRGDASCPTVLYEHRKGQRYVDYLRFASEVVARRIVTLSRTVKKSCEGNRLVAVSYGYVLDFPVPHSGHLAISEVLSAQSIDLLCAPVSYRDRQPTQPGTVPVPVASVRLHGKLFVLEDDTKPHTARADTPDDYNPRCTDAECTRHVRLRNATTALLHHAGVSWMDLWGEGWLNESEVWRQAERLSALYRAHMRQRIAEAPEVAVIVDERSLMRIQSPQALLVPLVIQQQEVLAKAGIHYGIYLQSDLVRKAFPDAKLYLFLNPLQIDSEVRAAIRERLQRDGKTLVWLYAVALYDENGYTPDGPRDVAGIAIKAQPWNNEMGSVISNDRHPISERLRNKQVGVRERINPSFYVLDEKATVLGEYIQTGLPSIAVKEMGEWRSVFIGERQLSVELLRGLCRYAGVHVWSQSSDIVRVAPPFLAVHSIGDGTVHLQLPQRMMVYDLTEGRLLAEEAAHLRLNMRLGQSALYAVGSYEQLSALGIALPPRYSEPVVETPTTSSGKKRRRRGGKKHRKRKAQG
ncbi:MAG: beta-galactosidase [Armatimonadota bacterium]|nr:beta-galactosidase [Armatimonadota bacterium]